MDAIVFIVVATYFAVRLNKECKVNEDVSGMEVRMNESHIRHDDAFMVMYKELIK